MANVFAELEKASSPYENHDTIIHDKYWKYISFNISYTIITRAYTPLYIWYLFHEVCKAPSFIWIFRDNDILFIIYISTNL